MALPIHNNVPSAAATDEQNTARKLTRLQRTAQILQQRQQRKKKRAFLARNAQKKSTATKIPTL